MKFWTLLLFSLIAVTALPAQQRPCDAYPVEINATEKADIAYIITTLANKKGVALLFKRSALNAAGDRVNHVHSLKFLEVIFTDPKLKADMKKIHNKSFVWRNFMDGMCGSLQRQADAGNMTEEQIDAFAKAVKVDPKLLYPLVKERNWNKFVETLIYN